jgi:hypothetical protein
VQREWVKRDAVSVFYQIISNCALDFTELPSIGP